MQDRTIERRITVGLLGAYWASARAVPVVMDFRYRVSDPLAVSLAFYTRGSGGFVGWDCARSLLRDGLAAPAGMVGEGDIQIGPSWHPDWAAVALCPDDEQANLLVPRRAITDALAASYRLVPDGAELVEVDDTPAWLGVLFDSTAADYTEPEINNDKRARRHGQGETS